MQEAASVFLFVIFVIIVFDASIQLLVISTKN